MREISLPLPTSQTRRGPLISLETPTVVVDYDYEQDDGELRWIRVRFLGVLAFEYRQAACCRASDIEAYNKMLEFQTSDRLDEMRRRYEKYLAPQSRVVEASQLAQFL